jgi:hypothetical protein
VAQQAQRLSTRDKFTLTADHVTKQRGTETGHASSFMSVCNSSCLSPIGECCCEQMLEACCIPYLPGFTDNRQHSNTSCCATSLHTQHYCSRVHELCALTSPSSGRSWQHRCTCCSSRRCSATWGMPCSWSWPQREVGPLSG